MAILQVLFIALCAVTSSLACMCMPEHPQKQFCNAEFAIRANVTSPPKAEFMPNNPYTVPVQWRIPERVFTLRLLYIFKGHAAIKANLFRSYYVKLYTPPSGQTCRVHLEPGVDYVLFGKIVGGNLYLSFCNWRKKWADVTPEQRVGMRTQYSKGCQCLIGFCFRPECRQLLTGCDGYDRNVNHDCRAKYQRCEAHVSFRGERRCAWIGRESLGWCERNVNHP